MKFTVLENKRPVFAALAVAGACLIVTFAVVASEPVASELGDSGWAVARPKTILDTNHTDSPQVRIAVNQLLELGHAPLLTTPAPLPHAATAANAAKPSFAAPAIELPEAEEANECVEAAAPEAAPVVEAETTPATKSVESAIDGPEIVFGNASVSADGWRPAHLRADLPRVAPSETSENSSDAGDVSTDITPVRPRFRPVSSRSSNETAAPTDERAAEASAPATSADQPNAKPAVSAKTFVTNADTDNDDNRESTETETRKVSDRALVDGPPSPLPPLTQNQKNLRAKIRRVIKSYYTRPLNSRDNDPWELMHGMLAYGVHSKIRQGGPSGETITLVGWLCYNKPSKGFTLLYLTPENELRAKQGVGLQGHMGQFLAMLAQCQVSPDYPIRVRNQEFTINDLIEAEKETCYPRSELTFKLIALMHYLDSDASWVNDQGQSWDIPRLIREELAQPIRGAACGGTHRLSGLSLAARTRVRRGEPLDGEYLRAAQFVEKYQNYAFQLQNRDGSLSTEWFRGRGDEDDIDRRVKTTGHILEWLCYSLPDKDVRSGRTFAAANYLSTLLATNFNHEWEVGPLGHAIHALRLYDERVFQPYDGQEDIAKKPVRKSARRTTPAAESRTHTMGF